MGKQQEKNEKLLVEWERKLGTGESPYSFLCNKLNDGL